MKKKKMIPLTDGENKSHEKKKFVIYTKNNLVLMKMMKMDFNFTIKSEIIVITLQNLEEQLMIFVI